VGPAGARDRAGAAHLAFRLARAEDHHDDVSEALVSSRPGDRGGRVRRLPPGHRLGYGALRGIDFAAVIDFARLG
jgi:hypothetical protein